MGMQYTHRTAGNNPTGYNPIPLDEPAVGILLGRFRFFQVPCVKRTLPVGSL